MSVDDATLKKWSRRLVRFLIDFGTIAVLCILFVWIKEYFMRGADFFAERPGYVTHFLKSFFDLAIMSALVTVYPTFLIGIRIYRSPKLLFILAWVVMGITFLYLRWNYGSMGYTSTFNGREMYLSGKPTTFGLFYEQFSPRFLLALYATWLYARHLMSRKSILDTGENL